MLAIIECHIDESDRDRVCLKLTYHDRPIRAVQRIVILKGYDPINAHIYVTVDRDEDAPAVMDRISALFPKEIVAHNWAIVEEEYHSSHFPFPSFRNFSGARP